MCIYSCSAQRWRVEIASIEQSVIVPLAVNLIETTIIIIVNNNENCLVLLCAVCFR